MKPEERKKLLTDVRTMIRISDDTSVRFIDRLGTVRQQLDDLERELLDKASPWFGPFVEVEDVPEVIKDLDVACEGTGLLETAVGRLERRPYKLTLEF